MSIVPQAFTSDLRVSFRFPPFSLRALSAAAFGISNSATYCEKKGGKT